MNCLSRSSILSSLLVAIWAVPSVGQEDEKKATDERLATKVTLKLEGATLEELLNRLAKDTNLTFVVISEKKNDRDTLLTKKVAQVSVKDVPLGKFLDDTLKSVGGMYRVKPDYIEIAPAK